ncbi:hypothetical protein TNCV_4428071 [Trichonephila clavipes]|nr:hypothetical protein TNCV_4428071 [Trichonephila clavipes]
MTSRLIDPPYGIRETVTELISVAPAYCLRELMELGGIRGALYADPLHSPIRDNWERERGPPKRFKESARKVTRIFCIVFHISFCFFFEHTRLRLWGQPHPKDQEKGTVSTS